MTKQLERLLQQKRPARRSNNKINPLEKQMKAIFTVVLIFSLCMVVSCVKTTKTPVIKYEGPIPQTPETILRAFTFDNVSIE